jgi:hypothetical protein
VLADARALARAHGETPATTPALRNDDGFADDKPAPPPPPAEIEPPDKGGGDFYVDFDRAHLGVLAYLATARNLARKLEPDAELIEISIRRVLADGSLDWDHTETGVTYHFRSAARGEPPKPPRKWQCEVSVEVSHNTVHIERVWNTTCDAAFISPPRCTIPQVIAKAITKSLDPKDDVWLGYNGVWLVTGQFNGNRTDLKFRDDCR